jgi:hypothetical protein
MSHSVGTFKSDKGQRTLYAKYLARHARSKQKMRAVEKVPFLGVRIDRTTVRRHRYLNAHGLDYSASVARVTLPGDVLAA